MATERPLESSEFPDDRFEVVERREYLADPAGARTSAWPRAAVLSVTVLAAAAAFVWFWLALRVPTPWIMIDELLYSELAKSFAESGEFLVREQPTGLYALLYPLLLSPAWLAGSMATTYALAKAINVVLMMVMVVAVYFWARRLVSPPYVVLAVALVLLMPSFAYTGALMTENAFAPALVVALFAIALTLERPSLARQLLAVAAIGVACAARLQGLVLLAVFPTALVLKLSFDLRAEDAAGRRRLAVGELRQYLPSAVILAGLGTGYVAVKSLQGRTLSSGLGAYGGITQAEYSLSDAAHWILFHFAELTFSVAVVPVSALLVLVGLAWRWPGRMSSAERAFVAVAASATFWLVLEVGAFASRFTDRINERYLFGVAPLLFLALAVWLARALPRPPLLAAFAAVTPAALLLTLPLERVVNVSIFSDAFALLPLLRVSQLLSVGLDTVKVLLVVGCAAAAALFALVPRRLGALVVPAAVAGFLALSSYNVVGSVRGYSAALSAAVGAGEKRWVDERLRGGSASVLYGSSADPSREAAVLWQTEFWNRRVAAVYSLNASDPAALPFQAATLDRASGRIRARGLANALPRYFIVERSLELAGDPIAERPPGLVLYRVTPPPRLARAAEGIYADGWMGERSAYSQYATPGARPGRVRVSVSRAAWGGPDVPGNVRIAVGTLALSDDGQPRIGRVLATRRWVVHSLRARVFILPTPRPPFRVEVGVRPTFSPARFGRADTRQLGAQVDFRFSPS